MRKKGTVVLAAALTAGMLVPSMTFAAGPVVKVGSDSSVQMSSAPEVVYVNNYTGVTRSENFNQNWKFYLGDASGAESPGFDDSGWNQVNLPHDYSIEQEYTKSGEAESAYLMGGTGWYRKNFTLGESAKGKRIRIDFGGVYMNSTVWVNGTQVGTHPYGYTPFSFDITEYVNFDGENVITVKVDHQTPSSRWYSGSGIYRSVDLTITEPVHVDLYGTKIETPNLETEKGGNVTTNISTTVANDSDQEQNVVLKHTVFPKDGEAANAIGAFSTEAHSVPAGGTVEIEASGTVTNPTLWDTSDNPALYTVRTEVQVDGQTVDTYDTDYGFRYFDFDANTGFTLNGDKMKLKGVCMHHDQGSLGAEAWESAIDRQVRLLKEMGCNSIRVTHNPAAEELIEACNEQGILVIDEVFDGWIYPKNGNSNDYSVWFNKTIEEDNEILGAGSGMTWAQFDLTATVKRGWNDPSVIMWSLGNEVSEGTSRGLDDSAYTQAQTNLITWTQALDGTRPVTRGDNKVKGSTSGAAYNLLDALAQAGGVVGTNYTSGAQYDTQHAASPDWLYYGSETASSVNSRGVYDRLGNGGTQTPADQKLTSYDNSKVGWGALASEAWYDVITRDFVAGEYVWTGFDYMGEPTPWNGTGSGAQGTWPSPKNSYFGIIDTAGLPKDTYYFYQSQWNDGVDTLHILPAWNEDVVAKDNSGNVPVVVYTDAAKVELFFTPEGTNETRSLGEKAFTQKSTDAGYTYQIYEGTDKNSTAHKNLYLTWNVPYENGTITAKAWDAEGNLLDTSAMEGRTSVTTTGEEAKLSASADRTSITADGEQLSYITIDVTDENGNIVPDAANNVKVAVEGDGKLIGIDNGKQDDHQSYQDDNRNAFSGSLVAIVQSSKTAGEIRVTASADGLEPASITVTTTSTGEETGSAELSYYRMSRNYYVKTGNMPQLPTTVKAVYSDGSESDMPVTWNDVTAEQTEQTGTFSVAGVTEAGDTVSVTVNMIDQVAALLNYSTAVPVGTEPTLPDSRPAVLQDGEVTAASFPVTWGEPEGDYNTAGSVIRVTGTANVLGQEMTVTADVRVQEQQVTIGNSISGSAHLSQDVPANQQSDTLEAIIDGSTAIGANNDGGPNETAWSNWGSRQDDPESEITFRYDTQQRIGQVVVYFARDNSSMTFPNAGTTKLYTSESGEEGTWTELAATETIAANESPSRVKAYTYTFDPVTATYLKLKVVNATQTGTQIPCTGITEVVINEWTGTYTTNSGADFTAMTVNGLEVSAADLAAGVFNTEAILVDSLEYTTSENAAVTELPAYEGKKVLIIESEDHSKRNTFTINLGAEVTSGNTDPADDSMDYPVENMTATAGSEYTGNSATDGPASWALDGNTGTWWHTNWAGSHTSGIEERWITLDLGSPQTIDGYRYYSRGGQSNGRVGDYKIEVSADGSDWTEVATGTWENTAGWKMAQFTPVDARYVKLTGVTTYGEGAQQDDFMTAAEVRVRLTPVTTDISTATVTVPDLKEVTAVDADHPVTLAPEEIEVMLGDTPLRYGIDYIVTYQNNTAEGTAQAIITGVGQYGFSGSVSAEFAINVTQSPADLTAVAVKTPCRTNYTEGEMLDPTGLVLELSYSDGSKAEAAYSDATAADFTFTPALTQSLATSDTTVTVGYSGKTTTFNINVQAAPAAIGSIAVAKTPAKTVYNEGETFDPTGLELSVTYSDGTVSTVSYNADTASLFSFTPALGTALTADVREVTVAYQNHTQVFGITVNPRSTGSGGTQTGTQTGTGAPAGGTVSGQDKAVQTGDTADFAGWGAAALLAGTAAVIAGKKKKSNLSIQNQEREK